SVDRRAGDRGVAVLADADHGGAVAGAVNAGDVADLIAVLVDKRTSERGRCDLAFGDDDAMDLEGQAVAVDIVDDEGGFTVARDGEADDRVEAEGVGDILGDADLAVGDRCAAVEAGGDERAAGSGGEGLDVDQLAAEGVDDEVAGAGVGAGDGAVGIAGKLDKFELAADEVDREDAVVAESVEQVADSEALDIEVGRKVAADVLVGHDV